MHDHLTTTHPQPRPPPHITLATTNTTQPLRPPGPADGDAAGGRTTTRCVFRTVGRERVDAEAVRGQLEAAEKGRDFPAPEAFQALMREALA